MAVMVDGARQHAFAGAGENRDGRTAVRAYTRFFEEFIPHNLTNAFLPPCIRSRLQ